MWAPFIGYFGVRIKMRLPWVFLVVVAPYPVVWHADFARNMDWAEWNSDSVIVQATIWGESVCLPGKPRKLIVKYLAPRNKRNQVYQRTALKVAKRLISVTLRSSWINYNRVKGMTVT